MTISLVHTASATNPLVQKPRDAHPPARADWHSGQRLDLAVLGRESVSRYWVGLGDARYLVDSAVLLRSGDVIRTEVTVAGERPELRYLGVVAPATGPLADAERLAAGPAARLVDDLSAARHTPLGADQRAMLAAVAATATDPEAMVTGGLYLVRQGLPLESAVLDALHAAQTGAASPDDRGRAIELAAWLAPSGAGDVADWASPADRLAEAFELPGEAASDPLPAAAERDAGDGASATNTATGDEARGGLAREFVRWLLAQPDGGSIGYRYGSLPVLIGGELLELELAYFHHHRPQAETEPLRRLVMSLATQAFGRVEILAEAIDRRLLIRFASDDPAAAVLAGGAEDVRELVRRLGWQVDAVTYAVGHMPRTAARHVIDHVLDGGQFEAVL